MTTLPPWSCKRNTSPASPCLSLFVFVIQLTNSEWPVAKLFSRRKDVRLQSQVCMAPFHDDACVGSILYLPLSVGSASVFVCLLVLLSLE
ncbi:hypothetical protein K457DRAFT_348335 [Linnemannia elongata AG-77]|uniref:Uncharacterized protein n=1 Tax=Linnemannia elongata AG-77 TaxID=1314771 RepID=A0A197K5D3_9FUNG|nr:hypothetical protein K457DRAFT_348335 [Linnemannia elongata AG-77]